MRKLVIVGAGQYGQNIKDIVESNGNYDSIVFADDNSPLAMYKIADAILIQDAEFIVAIGDSNTRERLYTMLNNHKNKIATIVHKSAYIAESAVIDEGSIIEPNVTVASNVTIGKGSFVCAGAVINHNASVGNYSQIDVGAIVSARTIIRDKTKIKAGEIYV